METPTGNYNGYVVRPKIEPTHTIFYWNNYLETQYIWDGTCGYHAIKNTLNLMYLLNEYHITSSVNNYSFNDLLVNSHFIHKLKNYDLSGQARNYYIKLNNGYKSTNVGQLKYVNENVDKNNNLYFWDIYEEKSELVRLITNRIKGTYGCIVYYEDILCKHWYGILFDVLDNSEVNIHLLDSFGMIWPDSEHLNQIIRAFNLKNVIYDVNYSKLLTHSYKAYQLIVFIVVYFILLYGIFFYMLKPSYRL